jgi:hypothetical protein
MCVSGQENHANVTAVILRTGVVSSSSLLFLSSRGTFFLRGVFLALFPHRFSLQDTRLHSYLFQEHRLHFPHHIRSRDFQCHPNADQGSNRGLPYASFEPGDESAVYARKVCKLFLRDISLRTITAQDISEYRTYIYWGRTGHTANFVLM